MIEAHEITGVILCGGKGTRMGGVEKPLQQLCGIPMVQQVRERLAPQVSHIVISANSCHEAYSAWNDVVLSDMVPNAGPLGGILTACGHTTLPYLFCCPGDAPHLSTTLVSTLARALTLSHKDMAIPHDGVQPQHLFMLLSLRATGVLREYVNAGHRSVGGFAACMQHVVVDASSEYDSFMNVNTGLDLRALEHQDSISDR